MVKGENRRFFDDSLQTVTPVTRQGTNEVANTVESDHDAFLKFRNNMTSMFHGITDGKIYLLHQKFKDSENVLQDAINDYLDDSNNFPNHEARVQAQAKTEIIRSSLQNQNKKKAMEPSVKRINYEYVSRKKNTSSRPVSEDNSSKYFKKAKTAKVSSQANTKRRNETLNKKQTDIDLKSKIEVTDEKVYWKKYIGTLNMSCWCTRSLYNLKSIYLDNNLKFTKPHDSEVVYVNHQPSNSTFHRELGRLSEDLAQFIGPLIDEKVLDVECKLFFVENERLTTGDSFVIRVDCFLNEKLFEDGDNNSDADFELEQLKVMKGSNGNVETGTRLKSSMLKLFEAIGLKPVKDVASTKNSLVIEDQSVNDNTEYDALQESVDFDDKVVEDENSTIDDETDPTKLSMNQVKDLYKSAELNQLQQSLPESMPENFGLSLRPYQKQGLSWMLQREKEYDLIGLNNNDFDKTTNDEIITQLKNLENSVNPLWNDYTWPTVPDRLQHLDLPPNCTDQFYFNLYNGTCSMKKPIIKNNCKGGILADEMGLGKTITTLSLILSCPKDTEYESLISDESERTEDYAFSTTLIVVPMALLTQWEKEFMKCSKGSQNHRCYIYYGSDTLTDIKKIACGPDPFTVILTTYGMIQSEWSNIVKSKNTGLFSVKFHRIILDEGHNIRNRMTKTAKAIYELKSDRRWILTGTPIINRLEDLFSLIHYLNLKPWSYYSLWKQCISVPFDTGKEVGVALNLLKSIIDPILLRRTKNQKDSNGNYLVVLPPKEVTIEKLKFNKREEAIYNWLKEKAVNSFDENFKSGMVFKNYSSILTQLLRLRQVCCHVDLIKNSEQQDVLEYFDPNGDNSNNSNSGNQKKLSTKADDEMLSIVEMIEANEEQQKIPIEELQYIKNEIYKQYPTLENIECAICTDNINVDTCIITECKHCFCLSCLTEHFEFQSKHAEQANSSENEEALENINGLDFNTIKSEEVFCPICRKQINRNRLFMTVKKNDSGSHKIVDIMSEEMLMTQNTNSQNERTYFVRPFTPNNQSSKINALLIHLEQIKQESPGEHVIVFSQFTSFLDIIGHELEKYVGEFKILKFDGRLNLEQRQKVLNEFEKDIPKGENKLSVLLLSLKAGGVGLNLTVASWAFLMDPHWNNAIEFQAIDRIHRVGQMKNVRVIRFIMDNSIEERMLKIQENKNQLGEALTMSDEERKKKRVEELQSLFQK